MAATYDYTVDSQNDQLGSGVAKLYLDGELVDTDISDKRTSGASTFYLGHGQMAPWLHGYLDEVAYFDKALSATRIYEIWLADPPPGDAGEAPTPGDPDTPTDPTPTGPSDIPGTPADPSEASTAACDAAKAQLAKANRKLKKARHAVRKAKRGHSREKLKKARRKLNRTRPGVARAQASGAEGC